MRKIPLFHKGMTVFFNFFKKSATKRLLAYRYGARKGNLLGQPFDPEHVPDMLEWGDRHLSGNYIRTAQLLDVDEAIRKYEKPVLLVHGDADEAVPIEYSIDAAKKYKNAELVQIPGDTHCYDEHLDQVTAAVKKFLGEMENREG